MEFKHTSGDFADISAGDALRLSGTVYTARDAALKIAHKAPPFDLDGAFIYFAGPTAAPEGYIIGSIGPTTSGRMERYIESLLGLGAKGFIGKGGINGGELFRKYGGVYLCAVGGAGAMYAGCVRAAEIIAYPELGCEAVRRLEVCDMPLFCGIDTRGKTLFFNTKRII